MSWVGNLAAAAFWALFVLTLYRASVPERRNAP